MRMGFMLGAHTYRLGMATDEVSYFNEATNIARALVQGRGYSSPFQWDSGATALLAPGFPVLYAVLFRLFGVLTPQSIFAIFTVQSLVAAAACFPIVAIGRRTVGLRAGYIAAIAWAVFPWFSKWPVTWIWDTSITPVLLTALIAASLILPEKDGDRPWLWFGAAWGVSLLFNPALGCMLPVTLAWSALAARRNTQPWFRRSVLAVVTCCVVVAPWLIRNYVVFRAPVFIRSNFWLEFAIGNYHGSMGRGWGGTHPEQNQREFEIYLREGEVRYMQRRGEAAKQFVRGYPMEFASLTARRALYFWDGSSMEYRVPIAWYWLPGTFAPISCLTLPALLLVCFRRVHGWQLFLAAILLFPIPYYLAYGSVRYRHVLEPLILLMFAYAALEAWGYISARVRGFRPDTTPLAPKPAA